MDRRFCVAPMMDWTDRHCRFFHRLLTRRALIYTEMVTTGAVLHGDRARLIWPMIRRSIRWRCSSAAANPTRSPSCARIGADFGYDEINLNVGCPSDRVQEGRFGACLMAEPALVGDCVAAMKAAVANPGDGEVPDRHRRPGSRAVALEQLTPPRSKRPASMRSIVHARKAWLAGLSPRENRDIPPLDYDRVYRLKAAHPTLPVVLNGGDCRPRAGRGTSRPASTAS